MRTSPLSDAAPPASLEAQVLLCCAQSCHNPASTHQLSSLLRQGLDWTSLIQLAERHRVLPLVYRALQAVNSDTVPQPIRAELYHDFHANAQRNLFLAGTLLKLLRLLENHQIPAISYKGPVLAMLAYGNLTLRQFGDLDILVHKKDVARAQDLLLSQGYRWWEQRPLTFFPRQRKVYELFNEEGQVLVELHWAVTSSTFYFPLDPVALWQSLETVVLLDKPVHTLSREHLLLILCAHGAKHHWDRLAWICDIAMLLHVCADINWQHLLEHAERLGSRRMLLLGIFLAYTLLGTSLPDNLQQRLRSDPAIPGLAAEVQARLFTNASQPLSAIDRPLFYLRLRDRLRHRLRCSGYLMYHMMTSRLLKRFARGSMSSSYSANSKFAASSRDS